MQFKLISIDSDKPNKIELKTGTHIFGRGKLLSVDDKRISRKHGQLEVTDDSLIVTALHQNPCFYRRVGTTEIEVLKQNNSVHLNSGDRLGLLLGSYWFEVLHCSPSSENVQEDTPMNSAYGEETDNKIDSRLEVTNTESNNNDKMNTESRTANDDQASPAETLNKTQNDVNEDCGKEDDEKEAKENELRNEQEKNMDVEEEHDGQTVSVNSDSPPRNDSASTCSPHEESQSLLATNENQEEVGNENQPTESQISPHKRPHDTDEPSTGDVKKIKTEPEVKPEIKTEPQAGSSSSSSDSDKDKAAPPQAVLRERCMYGASCYRRNPAHLAQYSHPRDGDWGAGPRAPCPRGAACAKRDPRHWRDHDHPPGKLPPPPHPANPTHPTHPPHSPHPQPGRKKKRDRRDRSETPPESLIVTGKRARKTVARADWSGSDDGSDSDPFKTDDETDEWEPSSEYTETQD